MLSSNLQLHNAMVGRQLSARAQGRHCWRRFVIFCRELRAKTTVWLVMTITKLYSNLKRILKYADSKGVEHLFYIYEE